MVNELKVQTVNGKPIIDSRDVAAMVGKNHAHLIRDIRQYVQFMEAETKFGSGDFFMESSYADANGQERPCYLITKKGCDMIANKMTGKKGVLFTAAYVTAFEQMREALNSPVTARQIPDVSPAALARLLNTYERMMMNAGKTPVEICAMASAVSARFGVALPIAFMRDVPEQLCLFDTPTLFLDIPSK